MADAKIKPNLDTFIANAFSEIQIH
jgi:hypothetical protein